MSVDRFVSWRGERPTLRQVRRVLSDYFSDAATIRWDKSRWMVRLPGKPRDPVARLLKMASPRESMGCRWIEVWFDPEGAYVNVLTRQQDEYTSGVADRLADLLGRCFDGAVGEVPAITPPCEL